MSEKERYQKNNERMKERYERITLLVPKGTKQKYVEAAKERKVSTTNFFIHCAEFAMEQGV